MFSHLDPFFSMSLRHAEPVDTRQDIHRHDPAQDRLPRQKNRKNKADTGSGFDDAVISVVALKAFLEQFLYTVDPDFQDVSPPPVPDPVQESAQDVSPIASPAAQAAAAYQSRATAVSGEIPQTHQAPLPSTELPALSSGDIRIMHQLLQDIESLQKAGIHDLRLTPAESFLESLVQAAHHALNR